MARPKQSEEQRRLRREEDFCLLSRFDYSVAKLAARYEREEVCPSNLIAAALDISEDQIEAEMQKIVVKLRRLMGVEI